MSANPIDYDALAKQAGALTSPSVDYDALAKRAGALSSTPPPVPTPTGTISNRPNQPIRNFLEDAEGDLKYGTGRTFIGRAYKAIGGQPLTNNVPPAVSDMMGGPLTGPLEVGHGLANAPYHPVRGFNEVVGGVGKTLTLPLAATQPEFMAVAPIAAVAQRGAQEGLTKLGADPENAEAAVNAAGLGLGVAGALRKVPSAKAVTTNQLEAANALRPPSQVGENFPSTEAVLPEIRQAAAKDLASQGTPDVITRAINKVKGQGPQVAPFRGRAGAQRFLDYTQKAIDAHEQQVNAVKAPYLEETMDASPAADAARSYITPEMRNAAQLNPNGPEARTIGQIEDIARQNDGRMTIADADARRHRYNDELNSEYGKSAGAQDVSPAVTQAKKAAADTLRTSFYNRLSDLSGQDVRPLAQREGQLIEAKNDFTATRNNASNSKKNAMTRGERLRSAVGNAINFDRPLRTATSGVPDVIRAATGDMPISVAKFNDLANRALSKLGTPEEEAPEFNPPSRPQNYDYEGARPGEPEIVRPANMQSAQGGREVPLANGGGVLRRPQLLLSGDVPRPSGNAAPEFTYLNGTRGDVLANQNGIRIPRQIGTVVNKGLLPEKASPTALPSQSDSSVVDGKNIEVPSTGALPEGAVPQLIRQFVENQQTAPASIRRNTQLFGKVKLGYQGKGSEGNGLFGRDMGTRTPPPSEADYVKAFGRINPFANETRVNVIHPNGVPGSIPASQLPLALSNGYKLTEPLK